MGQKKEGKHKVVILPKFPKLGKPFRPISQPSVLKSDPDRKAVGNAE
jgi:hypothetical protein